MREYRVDAAQIRQASAEISAGDRVLLSGVVYTARDAAHKRIFAQMDAGEPLPFDLQDAIVYYAGPTKAPEHLPIGSCGPTTSSRMDRFAPRLLDAGLCGMIGKGERSLEVVEAIVRNGGIYLCAVGGAGALACRCIQSCDVIAYDDLGCESVKRLAVKDFPLICAIDSRGNDLFRRKSAAVCGENTK